VVTDAARRACAGTCNPPAVSKRVRELLAHRSRHFLEKPVCDRQTDRQTTCGRTRHV